MMRRGRESHHKLKQDMRRNSSEFDDRLQRLALLAIKTGLNLRNDQELIVTAPLEAAALVHHIARIAYEHGAKLVTCLYEDPEMIRGRFDNADTAALDYAAGWISRGIAEALENGAARLYVAGPARTCSPEFQRTKSCGPTWQWQKPPPGSPGSYPSPGSTGV